MSGRILERSPMRAATDTIVSIEVHRFHPGVYGAKNRHVWNGWVELPEGILVIDGGYDARSARALADTIRTRSPGRPFRYLVLTSGHVEHVGGVRTFAGLGATVLAHPDVAAAIRDSIGSGAVAPPDSARKTTPARSAAKKKARPKPAAAVAPSGPLAEVKDRLVLGGPDRRVEIAWLGRPANSTGDLVVFLPRQRLLFTGDLAYNRAVPWLVDPKFSYDGWLASLDMLLTKRFDADSIVPGHGRLASRIDGLMYTRRYLVDAMDKAARLAAWNVSPQAMEDEGYLGAYEDAEYYDPIHFYNMRRLHQLSKGIDTPGRSRPGMVVPK
jgi:glyoxylase-like metal-dependent hydrolase (beta-lactamase superfamily II)